MHHYKYLDMRTTVALLWDVLSKYFGLKPYLTTFSLYSYMDIAT